MNQRIATPELPMVREVAPGVFEFWFYQDVSRRRRLLLFLGIASFGLVIGFNFVMQEIVKPAINSLALAFVGTFLAFWIAFMAIGCFCTIRCQVDTNSRTLSHEFMVFNRVWRRRTKQVRDGDILAIYRRRGESDCEHVLALVSNEKRWRFTSIDRRRFSKYPEIESFALQIARLLNIETRGYDPPRYFWE